VSLGSHPRNRAWTDRNRFYCIWDSFRAQHPLLTIIDPEAQTEMIRGLLDIYRHEGRSPFSSGHQLN
jgi:putative alpha-1,2-mannosidase